MAFEYGDPTPPSLRDWLRGNAYILKKAVIEAYRFNGEKFLETMQPILGDIQWGPSPYAFDWDCCVVLDTCRPDALEELAPEYEFLPECVPTTRSPASWSHGWMRKAFTDEYAGAMSQTAHVTWNAFSNEVLAPDDWLLLDEVWRDTWNDDLGMLPPRAMTERAVHAHRAHNPDRLLVHYMQPHDPYRGIDTDPFLHEYVGTGKNTERVTVWDRIKDPDDPLSGDEAWAAMLDDLRWVLDDVELLLENIDAERVLLTADHGEAFGEWGTWGHGAAMPFPALLRVPKVWLPPAQDRETLTGTRPPEGEPVHEPDIERRLRDLGYLA